MSLKLDPDFLRTSMDMWRAALDMTIPIHDSLKVHFMARRGALLKGFSDTGNSWSMMLNACTPVTEANQAALDLLKADVDQFRRWADSALLELKTLA